MREEDPGAGRAAGMRLPSKPSDSSPMRAEFAIVASVFSIYLQCRNFDRTLVPNQNPQIIIDPSFTYCISRNGA